MDEVVDVPRRRRWRRWAFSVALAAFLGVWAYGFWYDANRPSPEPLDPASLRAATVVCRSAVVSLSELAPAPAAPGAAPSLADRVTRVHQEDVVLTDLVTRLGAIHPIDHSGAKALILFAADWQHLTAARERYAEALLSGQKSPKLVIPVAPTGEPVTIRMRLYAEIHKLLDCTPDSLQGEIVEGPRTYPRAP